MLTVDRAFADHVETMLLADFEQSREITAEDSLDTHRLQQLGMRIARLISPIL
ncbi:cardiolipin synthetase [compost metagenome]